MFDTALKKSTLADNQVYVVALRLHTKGYTHAEILTVLQRLENSLINDDEVQIVHEATMQFADDV